MATPVIYWVGIGALGMYGYATGRLSNFVDNFKNKNDNPNNNKNNIEKQPQPPQTIIVQPDYNNNNQRISYLLPLGVACFIGLGGYYYYIHNNGTKKVIGKVEETAEETQTLVQKTDDNNSKRFEILDEKNENRAQTLEVEIRSEQRAGFNVISEQLYCLTQVAIQTLSALASNKQSSPKNEENEMNDNNEKLLNYCDKAQEMADTILSDEHLLKSKDNNLTDIKAEIQLRNQQQPEIIHNNNNNITPGGPNDNNAFDLNNYNQQPKIINNINIQKQKQNQEENENDNNILEKLQNYMKPIQIGYYVYENKNAIMLSSSIMFALYVGNKTFNYYYYRKPTKQFRSIEIQH